MEQQTGSKLGKEYVKTVYYHPTYLTYMQSTSEASLIAQLVKNLPATQKTWVQSLGLEDPLEEGMDRKDSPVFLHGESHGQRSLVDYNPWGCKESDTTERLTYVHPYL